MSEWFERYGFAPVHPGLLVGAIPLDANDVQVLVDQGVDRIVSLVEDGEYPPGARLEVQIALEVHGIVEARVASVDFGDLTAATLERAVDQVEGWLAAGHTVYLHCRAGWQRSATVAAAVIADRETVPLEVALVRLADRKPTASPLPHQLAGLRAWWAGRGGR